MLSWTDKISILNWFRLFYFWYCFQIDEIHTIHFFNIFLIKDLLSNKRNILFFSLWRKQFKYRNWFVIKKDLLINREVMNWSIKYLGSFILSLFLLQSWSAKTLDSNFSLQWKSLITDSLDFLKKLNTIGPDT